VLCATALGAVGTVLAGSPPGLVLGICLAAGSAAAAFAVQPRAAYLIIPVPALAYVIAASTAGLIHDRAIDTSPTALAVSAAQWIASGFLSMTGATMLVAAVIIARRLARRHHPDGRGYQPPDTRAADSRHDPTRPTPAARHAAGHDADHRAPRDPGAARRARPGG
jgi:hypothetical protein